MAGTYFIADGNDEIAADIPLVSEIIARNCRWVHPLTFRLLPVWCPWTARNRPLYDASWQRRRTNTKPGKLRVELTPRKSSGRLRRRTGRKRWRRS
jgi:hypothetical protein